MKIQKKNWRGVGGEVGSGGGGGVGWWGVRVDVNAMWGGGGVGGDVGYGDVNQE